MAIPSFAKPYCVHQVGQTAYRLLTKDRHGIVLAVISNAVYLLSDQGKLVWLATKNSPMHPRSLQLTGALPELTVGDPFHIEGCRLLIGAKGSLELTRLPIWMPPRLPSEKLIPLASLPERVLAIYATFDDLPSPAGFGSLISGILLIAQGHPAARPKNLATFPAFAWSIVHEVCMACLEHDFHKVMAHAEALVGLGEGLTPSGDDFLGGLLFCRAILERAYPKLAHARFPHLTQTISRLKPRTHLISFTLLRDHARGRAMEPLHQFVNALLTNQSAQDIRQAALQLSQVGHSTGWDLLAGVLAGMLLTFPQRVEAPKGSLGGEN